MKRVISIFLSIFVLMSFFPAVRGSALTRMDHYKGSFLLGDINRDHAVTAADARIALRASVGLFSDGAVTYDFNNGSENFYAADADMDKTISPADARILLRVSVSLEKLRDYCMVIFLSYDEKQKETVFRQPVAKGGTAAPHTPNASGNKSFIGWYESESSCTAYDFTLPVEGDIILYAKWYDAEDTADSDNDGLTDSFEKAVGSDPDKKDTDGDGLPDAVEITRLNFDPCSSDTDKDGIKDGDVDSDDDGLSNAEEILLGTDVISSDTDYDELSDYSEKYIYNTSPSEEDTDGDGVNDGTEVRIGSDPQCSETTFAVSKSSGKISDAFPVSIEVTAETDAEGADTLHIREITSDLISSMSNASFGYIANGYELTADGDLKNATIEFTYDKSLARNKNFDPAIYYYNEQLNELIEVAGQNRSDGRVTADVTHFSSYILLDRSVYNSRPTVYLSENADTVTDSNHDGICDYYTDLLNNGELLYENTYWLAGVTDMCGKDCSDWDNDGLLNGEEISVMKNASGQLQVKVISDPLLSDSDLDGFFDYTEVKQLGTPPREYDQRGVSAYHQLMNDGAYLYSVYEKSIGDSIAGFFNWTKQDTAEECLINFIYDYAPGWTVEQNAKSIADLKDMESAVSWIGTLSSCVGAVKNILSIGETSVQTANMEHNYYEAINTKEAILSSLEPGKKNTELCINAVKMLELPADLQKATDNIKAVIDNKKPTETEKLSGLQKILENGAKLISIANSAMKLYHDACETEIFSFASELDDVMSTSGELGLNITFPGNSGNSLKIAGNILNCASEVYDNILLYGKITANAQAFNTAADILLSISQNNKNEQYVRNAAKELAQIIVNDSMIPFYTKLINETTKEIAVAGAKTVLSMIAKTNPYAAIAEVVIELFPLTGLPEMSQHYICISTMSAVSDACKKHLDEKVNVHEQTFSYNAEGKQSVDYYLTQLAQSRLSGEYHHYKYCASDSAVAGLSNLLSGKNPEYYWNLYKKTAGKIDGYANELHLELSSALPFYRDYHSESFVEPELEYDDFTIVNEKIFPQNLKDMLSLLALVTGDTPGDTLFDCSNATSSETHNIVDRLIAQLYMLKPELWNANAGPYKGISRAPSSPDPLGKILHPDKTWLYEPEIKWVAMNVFNITEPEYEVLLTEAVENSYVYLYHYGDYLYLCYPAIGYLPETADVLSVRTTGNGYIVTFAVYDYYAYMHGVYNASVSLKTAENGEKYWSIKNLKKGYYYESTDNPSDIFSSLSEVKQGSTYYWDKLMFSEDGSFSGRRFEARDSMGYDVECSYHGKFTNVRRIDSYTYEMTLDSLTVDSPTEPYYVGSRLHKPVPPKLAVGETYRIYLPGLDSEILPGCVSKCSNPGSKTWDGYAAFPYYMIAPAEEGKAAQMNGLYPEYIYFR